MAYFQTSAVAHGGLCSGQRGPVRTRRLALVLLASLGEWAISWGLGVTAEMSDMLILMGGLGHQGRHPQVFCCCLSWLCSQY